jgi:hypothetical protein
VFANKVEPRLWLKLTVGASGTVLKVYTQGRPGGNSSNILSPISLAVVSVLVALSLRGSEISPASDTPYSSELMMHSEICRRT